MPVEKDKVLTAIEAKFKGKSITKTFKENIAAKWAAKIDNDTEIDSFIEDREDVILEAVSEADRRATDAVKKVTEKQDPPKPDDKPKVADDAPDWFKQYAEAQDKKIGEVLGKVTGYEQQTIEQRFRADKRLAGLPEFAYKGRIPKTDAEFEAAVTELAADFEPIIKADTFGKDKPGSFSQHKPAGTEKVDDDVANFAKKQNETFINDSKK